MVWFDAHADFHTEATTTSGYLGGMPLALAAGVGTPTLPDLLGLRPVPESQILLVDARDTDPGERALLDASAVQRQSVLGLRPDDLPEGDLYVHLDVDVFDPRHVPGLLYPVTGGPSVQAVLDALPSSWLPDASQPSALPRPGTTKDKTQPLTRSFCGTSFR